ncbi:MAG: hypothetical protein JXA69_17945 [Phycisphaerae bacterium]|nr:hypothetical protein [Phycisphaerae bacterium]
MTNQTDDNTRPPDPTGPSLDELRQRRLELAEERDRRQGALEQLRTSEGDAYKRVQAARQAYEQARTDPLNQDLKARDEIEKRRAERTEKLIGQIGEMVKLRRDLGAEDPRVEAARQAFEQARAAHEKQERETNEKAEQQRTQLREVQAQREQELDSARERDGAAYDRVSEAMQALEQARADLLRHDRTIHDMADQERARRVAELARRKRELETLRRRYGAEEAQVQEATQRYEKAVGDLGTVKEQERTAKGDIRVGLKESLPGDPAEEVARLQADYPIVLFPVRLETRFVRGTGEGEATGELRVRIYPDSLAADSHEPLLTEAEVAAGLDYWRKAWADASQRDAWTVLLTEVGPTRAAWIVQQTEPINIAQFPRKAGEAAAVPAFRELETRPPNWTRPPQARVLPDRWLVLAYRYTPTQHPPVIRVVSRPVQEPLALSVTLSTDTDEAKLEDAEALSEDGLRLDPEILWTFDFDRAEQAGMAVRIPLTEEDFDRNRGFQLILALGVKSSLLPDQAAQQLEGLFDNHHYTRGLAFVPQGTPTNNTRSGPSGYPPPDPDGAVSFAVERGNPLARRGSDGERFMTALGLPSRVADHIAGADRDEQRTAGAMAEALWPATIGYFLEQLMAPVFDEEAIQEARRHFTRYVRGRGPFPAFRVGDVPYALLPVSSIYDWQPDPGAGSADLHLPPLLLRLRNIWSRFTDNPPRINRTGDPDADLLSALGMEASTREVRIRSVLGYDAQWNLLEFSGIDPANWVETQRNIARQLLDAIGHPEWDPRVLYMSYAGAANPFRFGLVTGAELTADQPLEPLSETQPLAFGYINWIRTATVEELRNPVFPPGVTLPRALLYLMLRHAALTVYARAAKQIFVARNLMPREELREAELVGIVPQTRDRPTVWQRFDQRVAGLTGRATLGEFLSTPRATPAIPQDLDLSTYRAALRALMGLPTAELERLFSETLDVCSHRVDAWITSLVTKRLEELRGARSLGSHLGAYGWVENLRADPPGERREVRLPNGETLRARTDSDGYIYAPSMAHGATAAVLRNAYRTRAGGGQEPYAVNLSSARVRTALWLMDSVREGQPLGAVLGYRFERGLHERSQRDRRVQLDKFIDPFRQLYPLLDDQATDNVPAAVPGTAREAIAARNVVNGLRLREAWRKNEIPWDDERLQPGNDERNAIEAELNVLDDAVDALTDLLMAESVHQVIRGSTEGAGATLDTMAKGVRPPEPEIARVPRGGTSLFHRVGLIFGGDPLPNGAWADPPRTPRGRTEPYLNAWTGRLLGDPSSVRCRVTVRGREAPIDVTLENLQLEPLDVLALARTIETQPLDSELDRRVVHAAVANLPAGTEIPGAAGEGAPFRIEYELPGLSAPERTFPEILEIARALNEMLGGARPLQPLDLLPPEQAREVQTADLLVAELTDRAAKAVDELKATVDTLDAALSAIDNPQPGVRPDLDPLRDALRAASLFGIAAAFPLTRPDSSTASQIELVTQGRSVLSELQRRHTEAEAETDPIRKIQAVFGREFMILPRFKPARPDLLERALTVGPDLGNDPEGAVSAWFAQAARVRTPLGRWRRLALYAGTMGTKLTSFGVMQLPHEDGARWVALPFGEQNPRPPAGRVSLVLHRSLDPATDQPIALAADQEWVGLLLDEWVELIPNAREEAGVVFQYDSPGAQAPQAVLLAVRPIRTERWDLETLIRILHQTLELAKIRAVDSEYLGLYGQLLPMTFLAANPVNETVATNFVGSLVAEAFVVKQET